MKEEEGSSSTNDDDQSYIGVRKRKWGKWVSEIREPGKKRRIWLGSYEEAQMAAAAYDVAALHLKGRSARFNFPPEFVDTLPKPASDKPEDVQRAAREAAMHMQQRSSSSRELPQSRVGLSAAQIEAINESPLDSPNNKFMWMDIASAPDQPVPLNYDHQIWDHAMDYSSSSSYYYYSIWD